MLYDLGVVVVGVWLAVIGHYWWDYYWVWQYRPRCEMCGQTANGSFTSMEKVEGKCLPEMRRIALCKPCLEERCQLEKDDADSVE